MEILVLGSNGRLGRKLCPYLKKKGHKVYEFFRQKTNKSSETFSLNLDETLNNRKINVIINLIALTDVKKCEIDINEAYNSNILTLENIIPFISKRDIHLIHISTDQVYSGDGPHIENNISPINVYGLTKYVSEIIASSVNSTILRTNYIGKCTTEKNISLSDWLYQSLIRKSEITLFNNIFFSPLYIKDLCKILEYVSIKQINGTFNLGSKGNISKAKFGLKLAEGLGMNFKNVKLQNYDDEITKIKRPLDMSLNCSKFENEFNFELPDISKTVKNTIDDYKNIMS